FERALPALGSDFDYWYAGLQLWHAVRLLEHHNLVMKAVFGYGDHMPFQQEYAAGGTAQRGWKNDQFRGDLKLTGNLEYSFPMFTVHGLAVRGLGFFDSSYVTFRDTSAGAASGMRTYLPDADVKGLAPLKDSVGVG